MGTTHRRAQSWIVAGLAVAAGLGLAAPGDAAAGEIVYADGRRETVEAPRQDSKGQWTATSEGRRMVLRPGEVVVVVDDAGKEAVTIPDLADGAAPPETAALVGLLRDPKNEGWRVTTDRLAAIANRGVHEALAALASDKSKEVRLRAVQALARLHTKESVVAATRAVLAEKDAGARREAVSALFSVQEIFRRSDVAEALRTGLADKDAVVRVSFALLAPRDVAAAAEVLRMDGLKHADHHIRESAAMELAERGDGAGESVLVGMLARTRMPGVEGDDALMERLLVKEQVTVCRLLGKLGTEPAKAALKKAAASKFEAVRKAAEAALAPPPAK